MNSHSENFPLTTLVAATPGWHPALELLLRGRANALAAGRDPREYAVRGDRLCTAGLTEDGFRVLVANHCVEDLVNAGPAKKRRRAARGLGKETPSRKSSFLWTDAGMATAVDIYQRLADEKRTQKSADALYEMLVALGELPHWLGDQRDLWFHWQCVKRLGAQAFHQQRLAAGFEEIHWRRHLDDPLPREGPNGTGVYSQHLRDAVRGLNEHQEHPLLHFLADGTGRGISWHAAPPR